jgi:hypothetical protein
MSTADPSDDLAWRELAAKYISDPGDTRRRPPNLIHWHLANLLDPATVVLADWKPDPDTGNETSSGQVFLFTADEVVIGKYSNIADDEWTASHLRQQGIEPSLMVTVYPRSDITAIRFDIKRLGNEVKSTDANSVVIDGGTWSITMPGARLYRTPVVDYCRQIRRALGPVTGRVASRPN